MRFTASADASDKYGCLFLVLWNIAALAATIILLMNLELSAKTRITFGILDYTLLGLWGGVKVLSLIGRLRR